MMQRRDLSMILAGSALGSIALSSKAQAACTPPCFPLTPTESAPTIVDYQYPPGDVRRYGATGNGITNDQPAIQAAINAAPAGTVVFIPPHVAGAFFKLNNGLTITKPLRLLGAGAGQTTLNAAGLASGAVVLDIDGTVHPNLEFVELTGLTLMSDNNSPDLLRVNRASNSAFRDIGLHNGRYGLVITGNRTFSNTYDRVICVNTSLNTAVRFLNYTGGGHHTFIGCGFLGGYGLIIESDSSVVGLSLTSCTFEATTFEAIYSNGLVQGLNINGCRFEKCGGSSDILIDPAVGKSAAGITIQGCFFETDAAQYVVQFGGSGSTVRGFSIAGNYAQDYSSGLVRLNGEGESGAIVGNRLQNVPAVVNAVRPAVLVANNENQTGKLGASWQPPLVTPTYTVANLVVDRSYDVSATSTAELARVLGSLIADLRVAGLVK